MTFPLPPLTTLIFLPLLGALLTLLVSHPNAAQQAYNAKRTALFVSVVTLLLAAYVGWHFNPAQGGYQLMERKPWVPSFGLTYLLGVDGISLPLMLLTALLTPLCLLASWNLTDRPKYFFASFLALEAAVMGVFAALDFILFYVFWEAMLIPMFLIIGIWGGEKRVYAALKFFLYTFVGSVLMLVAILYLYAQAGTFDIPALTAALRENPALMSPLAAQLVFLAFFAAFAVKVPMWPFHTWLPDAHVQAPTAGSVILAGVLLKMGAYGFLRFSLPMLPEASAHFAPFIFVLSAIAVVYAALVAYAQTDIKKMIAYSSVSHMGLVTLALFAAPLGGGETALHGGLLVMLNHGIVSAGLFLAIGVVYERLHTRDLTKFGGLVVYMPRYAFVLMTLTLAAVALPGTNGFVGEFLSLAGSFPAAPVATAVATTGVIFGALYMLWLYRKMVFGTPSAFVEKHKRDLPDLGWRESLIFAPLIILVPLLGILPGLAMDMWRAPVEAMDMWRAPVEAMVATEHVTPTVIPAQAGTQSDGGGVHE
ncbi:MAG: NADH-quinone oxidoreductase subunit M [Pseudomonadaceae bacterium]|nr:NADH-quinone oxidoreductase subunit M [Pseudomonadaceae bacterium]